MDEETSKDASDADIAATLRRVKLCILKRLLLAPNAREAVEYSQAFSNLVSATPEAPSY